MAFSHHMSEVPSQLGRSQSYTPPPGGLLALNTPLGFTSYQSGDQYDFTDAAYDMYLEPSLSGIPHSASTLTIRWFASGTGYEGGIDESWGMDNVQVSLNGVTAVPEPSTRATCGVLAAIGAILGFYRRSRQLAAR